MGNFEDIATGLDRDQHGPIGEGCALDASDELAQRNRRTERMQPFQLAAQPIDAGLSRFAIGDEAVEQPRDDVRSVTITNIRDVPVEALAYQSDPSPPLNKSQTTTSHNGLTAQLITSLAAGGENVTLTMSLFGNPPETFRRYTESAPS
jgi:hypothetical protein